MATKGPPCEACGSPSGEAYYTLPRDVYGDLGRVLCLACAPLDRADAEKVRQRIVARNNVRNSFRKTLDR